MHHPFIRLVCFVSLWVSLLGCTSSTKLTQPQTASPAPAPLPTGTLLQRVPLPPGGLIPYRKGALWGYADTTGHVVVAPQFTREPQLFLFGFGQLPPLNRDEGYITFINARGETLQADDEHMLVFTADSSLQLLPRRDNYLRPAVGEFRITQAGAQIRTGYLVPPTWEVYGMEVLGEQRSAIRRRQRNLPAKALVLAPQQLRYALVDGHSRALTGFVYSRIYPFREGFARFERDGGWGLMNRQGREIFFAPVGNVSDFYQGRAVVQIITGRRVERYSSPANSTEVSHAGIIDTTGRLLQPLRAPLLYYWLVPGKVICEGSGRYPHRTYRLLDPQAQPLLNGLRFAEVHFEQDTQRLLVTGAQGEAGLLDTDVHWIVPWQRQQLYLDQVKARRTSLAVAREGRHGLVALQDGRVLVPLRYDTVYTTLHDGVGEVGQQGQHLIVNFQGRELAAGWLEYLTYRANVERGVRLWEVRTGQHADVKEAFLMDSVGHTFPATKELYRPDVLGPGLLLYATRRQPRQGGVRTLLGREVISLRPYQAIRWEQGYLIATRSGVDSLQRPTEVYDLYSAAGKLVYSDVHYKDTPSLYVRAPGWVHLGWRTLLSPTGELLRLSAPEMWAQNYFEIDNRAGAYPFQFGVARVSTISGYGYITRGGRRLWANE